MKKAFSNFLYIIFLLPVFITSCSKDKVSAPHFDVQSNGTAFKAGQPITFTFSGNPDYLTFYSGEAGNIYANRNRVNELGTDQTLKFTSAVASGAQLNNVTVMVSTDFDGTYTTAGIAKATWTDITAKAKLSTGASLASGSVSLNDFAKAGKLFYLGFRYYAPQNNQKPRNWTLSATTITNTLADGTVSNVIADFPSAGFTNVNVQNPAHNWVIGTSNMVMTGGNAGEAATDAWVVSTAVNLSKVAAPDLGVGIKSIDALLPDYTYTYAAPGTYKVTFVASNADVNSLKSEVKEMTITVTK